jgi:hypothetical protein
MRNYHTTINLGTIEALAHNRVAHVYNSKSTQGNLD